MLIVKVFESAYSVQCVISQPSMAAVEHLKGGRPRDDPAWKFTKERNQRVVTSISCDIDDCNALYAVSTSLVERVLSVH